MASCLLSLVLLCFPLLLMLLLLRGPVVYVSMRPQFAQAAAAARAAPTPLPSSALTNRTPIRRPRSVFRHASILSLNLGYFAYSVPSTACADQTSVKKRLTTGAKETYYVRTFENLPLA